jgi:hypothetical protein
VGFPLLAGPSGHVLETMTNTTLRTRIALCLSALAAAVALAAIAAPANAGAATNVQLRSDFYTSANSPTPMMAVNPANAATFMAAPNAPEARWSRELAGGGIFRFRNAQFQSCLKVPESHAVAVGCTRHPGQLREPALAVAAADRRRDAACPDQRGDRPRHCSAAVHRRRPVRHPHAPHPGQGRRDDLDAPRLDGAGGLT